MLDLVIFRGNSKPNPWLSVVLTFYPNPVSVRSNRNHEQKRKKIEWKLFPFFFKNTLRTVDNLYSYCTYGLHLLFPLRTTLHTYPFWSSRWVVCRGLGFSAAFPPPLLLPSMTTLLAQGPRSPGLFLFLSTEDGRAEISGRVDISFAIGSTPLDF